jgi:FkbM family methyltransferase
MRLLLKLLDQLPAAWIRAASAVRGRSALVKRATDWLPNLLRNREGRIQKGPARGLRFQGGNSAVGFLLGTHDSDVQHLLARLLHPGMTCYDIGANVGFTAVLAARCVGETGRVICFEPLPDNAALIRVNADLNGFRHVQAYQVALGEIDGEAEFRLSRSPTWGRLADAGETPAECGSTRVSVRRLDALVAAESLPPPQVIKMDVEGAEAGVLAGGRGLLERARPVLVIEVHHTFQAVSDALAGLDFVIRPLVPNGDAAGTDGEFQVLAYPAGHPDAEAFWAAYAAGDPRVLA